VAGLALEKQQYIFSLSGDQFFFEAIDARFISTDAPLKTCK
jgi:hypothetical protein